MKQPTKDNTVKNLFIPSVALPIGDTARELLRSKHMTQKDLARAMGRPQKTVSEIFNGKARLTAETAFQLEQCLGKSALFWMKLDATYQLLYHLHRQLSDLTPPEADKQETKE